MDGIGLRTEGYERNFEILNVTLSDAACAALSNYIAPPTVSNGFDFIAAGKLGDWIYTDIISVDLTRTMGFVNAMICGPLGHITRASGCFKLPADASKYEGMPPDEYHACRMSGDRE